MTEPPVVNHHADHPGFSGAIGLVAALGMLATGRGNARFAAELASVSDTDRVVDIGCGPGNAVRAAAQRGARVVGVDPSPLMLRLARFATRDHPNVSWSQGTAEALPVPTTGRRWCGRSRRCTTGRTSRPGSRRSGAHWRRRGACW